MPPRLYVGRANVGKSGLLYREILDGAREGAPGTLILPSVRDVARARAEFARKVPVGLEITTFGAWLARVWSNLGDGRGLVGPLVRRALVMRVIAETDFDAIAASARTPGFADVMTVLVARLCNPARRDAGGLVAEVQGFVERYDAAVDSLALIEPARASVVLATSGMSLGGPLFVNRFSDLSEAQERLIVAAGDSGRAAIALTWEQGCRATDALTPLVQRLSDGGAEVVRCTADEGPTELSALESRLRSPGPAAPVSPAGAVEVATAAGEEAEIELIADLVRRLVEEGTAPDRVAIVFRQPGTRAHRLATALGERGIRMDADVVTTVGQTGFGRAALDLLTIASGGGSRAELLGFLDSPYSGCEPDAVASLDQEWRRHREGNADRLLDSAATLSPHTHRTIGLAKAVADSRVDAETVATWQNLADALIESAHDRRSARSGPVLAEDLADAAAHRAFLAGVREAATLAGAITGAELVTSLAALPVPGSPTEGTGAVQLLDATKARSRRFDAVVIGGLTAAEFSAERPEPLQAGLERALGGRGGTEERLSERMLFYNLITRARRKLVLVRQSSDSAGEAIRASVFWEDVVEAYVAPEGTEALPPVPPGVPHTSVLMKDLAKAVPSFDSQRRRLRRAVENGDARLERAVSTALGAAGVEAWRTRSSFSVTELETYLSCPYKWFLERAVGPHEIDLALDARDMGIRAHEALAEFYRRLPAALGTSRVEAGNVDDCVSLFTVVVEELEAERRASTRTTLAEELAIAAAHSRARSVLEQDAGFLPGYVPAEIEWEFTAAVETVAGVITLRGKVDRIDQGPAGIVVMDYKLGRVHGLGSWDDRGLIQIPVYASIAGRHMGCRVAGGIYRSLATLEARGFWRADLEVPLGTGHAFDDATDEKGIEEAMQQAFTRAAAAIEGITSGRVEPQPLRREVCTYCLAAPFCPGTLS